MRLCYFHEVIVWHGGVNYTTKICNFIYLSCNSANSYAVVIVNEWCIICLAIVRHSLSFMFQDFIFLMPINFCSWNEMFCGGVIFFMSIWQISVSSSYIDFRCLKQVLTYLDDIFDTLLKALSDPSDEVVLC